MINKDNTCIIFGSSPFIGSLKECTIFNLSKKYYHIGLNFFVNHFNLIDNVLFSDYGVYDKIEKSLNNKHNVIISNTAYHHNFELENREKPKNIEYIFNASSEIFHDLSLNGLCMYKTCAHAAINYAYLKGYKNIVLCGVDLSEKWDYFHTKTGVIRPFKRINKIREILYNFKDYVNLYQLNPSSDLDIEKISIGEL